MNGRAFLDLARGLAADPTEAAWRTAVSRAYYAVFHVARELMEDLGFAVPRADAAHKHMAFRLGNSSAASVVAAGKDLDSLRRYRNLADYDMQPPIDQVRAQRAVQTAEQILEVLDDAALEPTRTQITDAMKVYERDVLQNVTWQP